MPAFLVQVPVFLLNSAAPGSLARGSSWRCLRPAPVPELRQDFRRLGRSACEISGAGFVRCSGSRYIHARMTRIVRTTYRYKRPPRKRKAVAIEAPAVVTTKSSRRPAWEEETAAEVSEPPAITTGGQRAQSSTPREAERVPATPPANDDLKPAIVITTSRKRSDKRATEPDNDPEATARVKAFLARMVRPGGSE